MCIKKPYIKNISNISNRSNISNISNIFFYTYIWNIDLFLELPPFFLGDPVKCGAASAAGDGLGAACSSGDQLGIRETFATISAPKSSGI